MVRDPEHPDAEMLADWERYFAPVAHTLTAFAELHQLRIEKYEKGSAAWNFHFRLRDGGLGLVQALRSGTNDLFIAGSRERRDLDPFRRFTRRWEPQVVSRDDAQLNVILKSLLTEIVELPTEQLESDGRDYTTNRWPQRDFSALRAHIASLPLATID
jgi:hypothetical protein